MKRRDKVLELLREQSTLTLATSVAGAPRAAPLFYLAGDDLRLYWFSSPSSEHSKVLQASAQTAIAVYRPTENWREIRGVQMRGVVSAVSERRRRAEIGQAYAERFQLGRFFKAAMARSRLYMFQPSWVRYIDNSRRFGYKFELELDGAGEQS